MKVYVITAGEYSDYCIQAVTLNREKAELICAINNRNIRYSEDQFKIEEHDTDEIQCESIGDVGICYTAKFDYKALENVYWGEPFYSFARNEIKRELLGHGYGILITATFPKDMSQEKARKIMKDRVAKWKAEREGL